MYSHYNAAIQLLTAHIFNLCPCEDWTEMQQYILSLKQKKKTLFRRRWSRSSVIVTRGQLTQILDNLQGQ